MDLLFFFFQYHVYFWLSMFRRFWAIEAIQPPLLWPDPPLWTDFGDTRSGRVWEVWLGGRAGCGRGSGMEVKDWGEFVTSQ